MYLLTIGSAQHRVSSALDVLAAMSPHLGTRFTASAGGVGVAVPADIVGDDLDTVAAELWAITEASGRRLTTFGRRVGFAVARAARRAAGNTFGVDVVIVERDHLNTLLGGCNLESDEERPEKADDFGASRLGGRTVETLFGWVCLEMDVWSFRGGVVTTYVLIGPAGKVHAAATSRVEIESYLAAEGVRQ